MGFIRKDLALLICTLVFVLYDNHVVCDGVVAMLKLTFCHTNEVCVIVVFLIS